MDRTADGEAVGAADDRTPTAGLSAVESAATRGPSIQRRRGRSHLLAAGLLLRSGVRAGPRGRRLSFPLASPIVPLALKLPRHVL